MTDSLSSPDNGRSSGGGAFAFTAGHSSSRLMLGDLCVDLAAFIARYRGKAILLRPTEFRLLVHFITNPDQVFSRAALIGHLGKDAESMDERTVDVWIGRLRRTLKAHGVPDPLRTVRSLGYVLDSPPAGFAAEAGREGGAA